MISKCLWVFTISFVTKLLCCCATVPPDYELKENDTYVGENIIPKVDTRHGFYRGMEGGAAADGAGSRRVFGGAAADLKDFPAVCALLDRYWAVRCTGTVLTEHWVLTAAHCVTPNVAYVKYNTRKPASTDGNVTAVHFLYRHPNYAVVQKNEGRGLDVTTLHHDVGLVRTRDSIELASSQSPVFNNLHLSVDPRDLYSQEVQCSSYSYIWSRCQPRCLHIQLRGEHLPWLTPTPNVLGFGRTERSVMGEELFAVKLTLVGCERGDWLHCVCGVAREPRGVCSGDSGGPVLYEGSPIGVTSMGPVQCALGGGVPPAGASSVFTALFRYADLINHTILDTDTALRMRIISRAERRHRLALPLAVPLIYLYNRDVINL